MPRTHTSFRLTAPIALAIGCLSALSGASVVNATETIVLDNLNWGDNTSTFADSVYVNTQSVAHGVCFTPTENITANRADVFLWRSGVVPKEDVTIALYEVESPASCFGDTGNIPLTSTTLKAGGNPTYEIISLEAESGVSATSSINSLEFGTDILFSSSTSYMLIIESETGSTTPHMYTKRWSGAPEIPTNIKLTAGDTNANNFAKQVSPRIYFPFRLVYDDSVDYFPSGYEVTYSTQYDTRFLNVSMGTATTTVDFTTAYYISPTEATSTQADKNPTMVRVSFSKQPSTDLSRQSYTITDAVAPTWGYGTTTVSLNLDPSSTYDVMVGFVNPGTALTGVVPFPLAYVYFAVTTDASGGIATSTTPELYDAQEEQAIEYQPCGITDIGGCISNSMQYLFTPSNASLDRFATLTDELEKRSPFVYVYQVPDYWDTLFNTTQAQSLTISASTSIGSITFLSEAQLDAIPLTDTVRTVIGYLLWVSLALAVYSRVTRVFNHQERPV